MLASVRLWTLIPAILRIIFPHLLLLNCRYFSIPFSCVLNKVCFTMQMLWNQWSEVCIRSHMNSLRCPDGAQSDVTNKKGELLKHDVVRFANTTSIGNRFYSGFACKETILSWVSFNKLLSFISSYFIQKPQVF
jgi:hypothetical protein